jgi:hypothetical protein
MKADREKAESADQFTLIRGGQPNVGHSHASPSTRDGNENLSEFLHERCLLVPE